MEEEAKNPCHSSRGKVRKLKEKIKGEDAEETPGRGVESGADMVRNAQIIPLTYNPLIHTSEY